MTVPPEFTIVVVTYRRDEILPEMFRVLKEKVGSDRSYEVVLVDNNADGIDREHVLSDLPDARIVRCAENLGCTGGRNAGIAEARGDVVLFLDDDALVVTEDLLGTIGHILDGHPETGILAFRSRNGRTGGTDRAEFPHTDKTLDPSVPFETFRFIGVAHAIRRRLLDEVGGYRPDFFYGMEEFELSFRAMAAGWSIRYEPALEVLHMKHSEGRLAPSAVVERHFLNKLKICWLHLPSHLALLTAVVWTARSIGLSRGRANVPRAWLDFISWVPNARDQRRPLSQVAARIRSLGGSPWR